MSKELRDSVDETTDLREVFFSNDKSKCSHVALSKFFVRTDKGCIMKCASCGELQPYECPCAVGGILKDKETGELTTMHVCDVYDMIKKYPDQYEE